MSAGVEGTVHLAVMIGFDGHVTDVKLIDGPPLLIQAAIDAVRQWVYRPSLISNEPTAVETTVAVEFHVN